jgi:hypothetical protein
MAKYTYKENRNVVTKSFTHAIDIYKDGKYYKTERFINEDCMFKYIYKYISK